MNLNPSDAQKSAGNYKKRHEDFQGLKLAIETPRGAYRAGIGKDGEPWSVKMPHDYGYIKRTEGADGDQIDAYVGHHKKSPHVFVIDQHDLESGDFDEHKVMLGFANAKQAAGAYDKAFSDGKGAERRRATLHLSVEEFKDWLKAGNGKKAVRGYASGGVVGPWDNYSRSASSAVPMASEPPKEDETSTLQASILGGVKGASANWYDELEGAEAASGIPRALNALGPLGHAVRVGVGAGRMALGADGAQEDYEAQRDKVRQLQKKAEEEHPVASTVSEIGGAMLLPTGKVGTAAQAARMGAGYGLASGLGSGEGAADSAAKGLVGTLIGGAAGAAAPKISEKLGDVGGWIGDKFRSATAPLRRMKNPEEEAIPFFMEKMKKDVASGKALSQEEIDFARKYGLPIMGGDLGESEIHGLARWAGDVSGTARGKMNDALNERYRGQADRLSHAIDNLTLAPNARGARESLEEAMKKANGPAYKAAFAEGREGFHSAVIDELMDAPVMQDAIKRAGTAYKNKMSANRAGPAFHELGDGTKVPTLEFMNQMKIELDSMYKMAERAGDKSLAGDITSIKKQMLNELDTLFPSYKKARGIAAEFFGADDAIDAGKQMFKLANSPELQDSGVLGLMSKMSSAERGLVASGYLTAMTDKIRSEPYSADVVKRLLRSPQAKELNEKLLGTRKAKEMEMMIYLEGFAQRLRDSVQGNSKTNQFMEASKKIGAEIGWAGAGLGAGSLFGANWNDPTGWLSAAGGMMFKRGREKYMAGVNEKFANKIADMVVSSDPQALAKAAALVAKNPYAVKALQKNYDKMVKVFGQQAPQATGPIKSLIGPKILPAEDDNE